MKLKLILCLMFLGFASFAQEPDSSPSSEPYAKFLPTEPCEKHLLSDVKPVYLPGKQTLKSSTRDESMLKVYQEAARIVFMEIAPKLGLNIPQQIITFLTSSDMAALAMAGGAPAPHFHDGGQISEGIKNSAGILEFVCAGSEGCPCHQMVRDTNTFLDTILVFAHVAGHLDFFMTSLVQRSRDVDQIVYSQELANFMTKLKTNEDPDEVDSFYHQLLSLEYLQDMSHASFSEPKEFIEQDHDFKPKLVNGKLEYPEHRHPKNKTKSILQAFVHNLPESAPAWKREMIDLFEKKQRFIPINVNTKVMNEGWATIMESFIGAYLFIYYPHLSAAEMGQNNGGVTRPSISNPYWMGREVWFRLLDNFINQDHIKNLNVVEQDRLFVDHMHRTIMMQKTDFSFIRDCLDDYWVNKNRLNLSKKIGDDGTEITLQVETRDPKRVAMYLANRLVNHEYHFPEIYLKDFGTAGSGEVVLEHDQRLDIPLDRDTTSKALFQMARTLGKTVVLKTIISAVWYKNKKAPEPPAKKMPAWMFSDDEKKEQPAPKNTTPASFPGTVQVSPQGIVKIRVDAKYADEAIALQRYLQTKLDQFREDLYLNYNDEKVLADIKRFETMIMKNDSGATHAVTALESLMSHANTAAQAYLEYIRVKNYRLFLNLRKAAQGKVPFRLTSKGIRVRVLPETPRLQLDQKVSEFRKENLRSLTQIRFESYADEGLVLGSSEGVVGDRWKQPKPPKGKGSGDGEDDGEAGDPSDQPGPGGEGEGDPEFEEVPLEVFGQILAEEIQLRNLRETYGRNLIFKKKRLGGVAKAEGQVLMSKTVEKALGIGMALEKNKKRRELAQQLQAEATGETGDSQEKTEDVDQQQDTQSKDDQDNQEHSDSYDVSAVPRKKQLVLDGLRHMRPEDYVRVARPEQRVPGYDIVIQYVMDTSSSMTDKHKKVVRQMVDLIRTVLRSKYKIAEEVFVIFNTAAEITDEKGFFTKSLGGGTKAISGINMATEIFNNPKFSADRFNRFVFFFSDGDDWGTETATKAADAALALAKSIEYFGYGHIPPAFSSLLSKHFKALSDQHKDKIGYAEITEDTSSMIEALRQFLGKSKE